MPLKGAESVIMFDLFLVVMLGLAGPFAGVTTSGPSFQSITTIQPPLLKPPPSGGCGTDPVCIATGGISQATAYIAWAVLQLPLLIIYAIIEIILFLNIALATTFDPRFAANGVPIISFFFVALQFVVAFEVFRIFRGSSTGL